MQGAGCQRMPLFEACFCSCCYRGLLESRWIPLIHEVCTAAKRGRRAWAAAGAFNVVCSSTLWLTYGCLYDTSSPAGSHYHSDSGGADTQVAVQCARLRRWLVYVAAVLHFHG